MSSKWSKQDRDIWNNSEVMKEMEKNFLDNLKFVKKYAQSVDNKTKEVQDLNNALSETKEKYNEVEQASGSAFSADDHEFSEAEEEDELANADVKEAVLSDLKEMVKVAIGNKNFKLAYRIERTIDEILDV